jgi:hypothetical protein
MRRYEVTPEDLTRALSTIEVDLIGDYGRGDHRQVRWNVEAREYRVYDHHALILSTASADAAAEEFNAISPRSER